MDEFAVDDKERDVELMKLYEDDNIGDIYDISGGDLANVVLEYLDFGVIARSDKTFW